MTRKILVILFGLGLVLSFSAQAGHSHKHGHGHHHHKKHHGHHHRYKHHYKGCKHGHRAHYVGYIQPQMRPRVEMGASFVYTPNGGVVIHQPYLHAHLGY